MAEPGAIIDNRYRVVSRIGSGGMADVYLAEDLQLGRQVALKVLYHRLSEDGEFVERFRREASSAAGLSHPNVVSVFDRGEWDGTYYIAMEYLPGDSLKAIVREQGALDHASAIDLVIQILQAARFAHQRGIIHRDLKPHNVIVDEEGRARVTDFGIARAGASDMTQTGSIMGTAQYLSPEQAQGLAVSPASDLYAVGIVLYELLTGTLPFDGDTAVTIALKQVSAQPLPPSALQSSVTPALDAVVLRALAKDPAQRFADAGEFIAALEEARGSLGSVSGAPTRFLPAAALVGAPAGPPPPPAPLEPFYAAEPAALLVPPSEEPVGAPPPGDDHRWRWIAAAVVLLAAGAAAALLLLGHTARVIVPTLARCQPEGTASAVLQRSGLKPQPTAQATVACPSGTVISQSPRGGTVVDKGSRVILAVSSGPGTAPLPAVSGLGRNSAIQILSAHGFHPAVQTQSSDVVKANHVITTDPAAGTEVQLGSPVAVVVSSGPAPVPVPDVTGKSQADASARLVAAGLTVGTVTQQTSATQTPGTVISQSPGAGASLARGGSVNLTVTKAPQDVGVPNVVHQQEAQAAAKLGAAGFSVQSASVPVHDPAQNGVVQSQSPAAGKRAKKGATVTIKVGSYQQPTTTTTTPTPPPTTTTSSTPAPPPSGGAPTP